MLDWEFEYLLTSREVVGFIERQPRRLSKHFATSGINRLDRVKEFIKKVTLPGQKNARGGLKCVAPLQGGLGW